MAKKKYLKVPRKVNVKCPKCSSINRLDIPEDRLINSFSCKQCKETIITPISSCCIICAFSNKKCLTNLKIEAKAKNLELRFFEKKEEKQDKPKISVFVLKED